MKQNVSPKKFCSPSTRLDNISIHSNIIKRIFTIGHIPFKSFWNDDPFLTLSESLFINSHWLGVIFSSGVCLGVNKALLIFLAPLGVQGHTVSYWESLSSGKYKQRVLSCGKKSVNLLHNWYLLIPKRTPQYF